MRDPLIGTGFLDGTGLHDEARISPGSMYSDIGA